MVITYDAQAEIHFQRLISQNKLMPQHDLYHD